MKTILDSLLSAIDRYENSDPEYYQTLHTILLNMETPDDMFDFYEVLSNADALSKKLYIKKEITNGSWDSISLSDIYIA